MTMKREGQQTLLGRRGFLEGGTIVGAAGGTWLIAGCSAEADDVPSSSTGGSGSLPTGGSGAATPQTVQPVAATDDDGEEVYEITCDQIPNHSTGVYPNACDPWPILPIVRTWRIPMYPELDPRKVLERTPTPTISAANTGGVFGIAVNGVPFHTNAPFWKTRPALGWQFEQTGHDVGMYFGLDHNNAHTHPLDGYHYHALPWGLVDLLSKQKAGSGDCRPMLLMGWAADGYPIYAPFVDSAYYFGSSADGPRAEVRSSYRLKSGYRPRPSVDNPDQPGGIYDGTFAQDYEYLPGSGDLDECNGRFGRTPEYPEGIYHYFVTTSFPAIPRFWRGTPNKSFIGEPPEGEPVMLLPLMGPSMNWQPPSQSDLLDNAANSALFRNDSLPLSTSTRAPVQSITVDRFCYLFMVSSIDDKVYMCAREEGTELWSPWALLPDQELGALENSQPVSLDVVDEMLHVTQTVELPVTAEPGPYPYQPPYGLHNHRISTLRGRLQNGTWIHEAAALDTEP